MNFLLDDYLFLWKAISNEKEGKDSLDSLVKEIGKDLFNTILLNIAKNKSETFDLKCTVTNKETGEVLCTLWSSNQPFFDITIDSKYFKASDLEDIILEKKRVSKYLIDNDSIFNLTSADLITGACNARKSNWLDYSRRNNYKSGLRIDNAEGVKTIKTLKRCGAIWCCNNSDTGKTWLGIYVIDNLFNGEVKLNKFVYNPCYSDSISIPMLFLLLKHGKNIGLLIDDMQCDAINAKSILQFILKYKNDLILRNVFVFFVSWPSLKQQEQFREYSSHINAFTTDEKKYKDALLKKINDENIKKLCGDSLSLLSYAARLNRKNENTKLNKLDLLFKLLINEDVGNLSDDDIMALYVCAVLGAYDFETPIDFLEDRMGLPVDYLNKLIASYRYKQTGNKKNNTHYTLFLAHGNICRFIKSYLEKYSRSRLKMDASEIMFEYISSRYGSQQWKAIVQITGGKESKIELGFIWNLLVLLIVRLKEISGLHPNWNNNPARMYFVLKVAEYFGVVDDFKPVVDSFCNLFQLIDNTLVVDFKCLDSYGDFKSIKERMIDEDKGCTRSLGYEKGCELNENEMHFNWLLGFAVGLHNVLYKFNHRELADTALSMLIKRQNEDGYWYPKRVPWITGTILRGLSCVGLSVLDENGIVSKASDYLYSMMSNTRDLWCAHTGGWNNELETTSICLDGLYKCGVDINNDIKFKKAIEYLKSAIPHLREESIMDGPCAASLLIELNDTDVSIDYIIDYIKELADTKIPNLIKDSSMIKDQDIYISQSAEATIATYYITESCWILLADNLQELMDEFVNMASESDSSDRTFNDINNIKSILEEDSLLT